MKVLDAQEFHNGLQRNIQMLARLEKEMQNIKTQVEALTQMEESLKGHGGEALHSFYAECHLPLLQFFLTFKQSFIEILQQMDTALSSLEPDQAGYIQQAYLENTLELGLNTASQTTGDLTDEANKIMDDVSDIVSLPKLDDSDVQTSVSDAKVYRDQTVTNLMQFDYCQSNALNTVQLDLLLMNNWIKNIEAAMQEGVTDVNFPAEQWKAFTLQHPLQQQLAYRTISLNTLPGMNDALLPGSIYGANPYSLSNVYTDDSLPLFSYDIASANVSTSYVNDTEESEDVLGEFSYIAPEDLEMTEDDNGVLDKALGWGKAALDFFVLDDVKTIADPEASLLDKGIAIAAFIPVGKLLKVPKAIDKISDLNVDEVVEKIDNVNKSKDAIPKTYKRPSGFRKGVRDEVWEKAKNDKGNVIDPVSGEVMNKQEPWDMGHKPGFEFRKHQQSAMEREITRKQFLDEHNNPDHYRPELPSSNRSHKGEDLTDDYFGD